MLKAIIVDDEQHCIDRLVALLADYQDSILLAACCRTLGDAQQQIETVSPDIVFLDVHLNKETGFELLNRLSAINFEVVFITAYDTYAVEAFRFSALDYLLKPVDKDDFYNTMLKVREKVGLKDTAKKLEVLFHNFENKLARSKKIAVPTLESLILIEVEDILRFQSDGNYTNIHLVQNKKLTATKSLKHFENMLGDEVFFRIHKSHYINISHVEKYIKGKGGHVVMSDGAKLDVAIRRKEELLKRLMG